MPDAPRISKVLDRPEGMTFSELAWYNRVWGYDEHGKRVEVRGDVLPEPALTGDPPRDGSEYFWSPKMPKALPKGAKSKRSAVVNVSTDANKFEARGDPLPERRSTGNLTLDSGDPLRDGSVLFKSPKIPKVLPKDAKSKRSAGINVPTDANKFKARGDPLPERRSPGHLTLDSGDPLRDGSVLFQSPKMPKALLKGAKSKKLAGKNVPTGANKFEAIVDPLPGQNSAGHLALDSAARIFPLRRDQTQYSKKQKVKLFCPMAAIEECACEMLHWSDEDRRVRRSKRVMDSVDAGVRFLDECDWGLRAVTLDAWQSLIRLQWGLRVVLENNWVPKRRETYALKYELVFKVQHKIWRLKTGDFFENWRSSQTHSSSNASGNDNVDSISGQGEDDDVTVAFSNCAKDKTNDNWKKEEDNFPLSISVPTEEPPVLVLDPIPDVVPKSTATVACTEGDKYHIADDGKEIVWEGQDVSALLNHSQALIETCKSSRLNLTEKEEKWFSFVWNYDADKAEEGLASPDGVLMLGRPPKRSGASRDKTISGEYILEKNLRNQVVHSVSMHH